MTMEQHDDRLGELAETECLRLLATVPVGRVVFYDRGMPVVRLVNHCVDDGSVVFRTAAGAKRRMAVRNDVVAFEVDDYDLDRHLGWTVTVVGHATLVTDRAELERAATLPLAPWAAGSRTQLVRIDIEVISGRRLLPWAQRQTR